MKLYNIVPLTLDQENFHLLLVLIIDTLHHTNHFLCFSHKQESDICLEPIQKCACNPRYNAGSFFVANIDVHVYFHIPFIIHYLNHRSKIPKPAANNSTNQNWHDRFTMEHTALLERRARSYKAEENNLIFE